MPKHQLYYHLKPYLPWSLRLAVRRTFARRKRNASAGIWPINPNANRKPEGWMGWPDGKKFAVVLTHDVEGNKGLERCRQLAELEIKMGFRSSFNFIPEGTYSVPASLREELVLKRFEVGVHDLKHDGKLYSSKGSFKECASKINRYLAEWSATGFRSGFMHHNLDWLHDLDIKYDCSTFDTDPFEPQPDGVDTIFPFWVPNPSCSNGGYMELPYTLPQDSTLFLLLQETSADIWKKKVDWIVSQSGMVLVNTHPDYMNFSGENGNRGEFPAKLYEELLHYIKEKYRGEYFHALPCDVADYCAPSRPQRPFPRRRRVCMVSYSFYESDNRVLRYASALARRGDDVEVFALNYMGQRKPIEMLNDVMVHRIQDRSRNERGQLGFLLRMLRFFIKASFILARRHWRKPYDLIHVHNIPDFLVFSAWFPKFFGARVVLDIHDMLPEFYESKFPGASGKMAVTVLKWVERASAGFADHVIISNHLWHETFTARSVSRERCSVFINHVDTDTFRPRDRSGKKDKKIIIYPGGLHWHQGLDIAIRAFAKLIRRLPDTEFHIYGEGPVRKDLVALAQSLGLASKVRFFDSLPIKEIANIMAEADLGVVAKRADSFGDQAYSTKIMEFMSAGVPVVASNTKIDRFYFTDSILRFFESGNDDSLAEALYEVLSNDELRHSLVALASEYAASNSWEKCQANYMRLVDSLIASTKTEAQQIAPLAAAAR